jgi:hypothetical protein
MKKEHYILIAVALVAAYFLFFRKKETKVDAVLNPPPRPRPVPIENIPARNSDNETLAAAPQPMLVPQQTALAFNRPALDRRVVGGINITNGGSSTARVFGNRQQARDYYFNRGGAGACSFVELSSGQFEVNCA